MKYKYFLKDNYIQILFYLGIIFLFFSIWFSMITIGTKFLLTSITFIILCFILAYGEEYLK